MRRSTNRPNPRRKSPSQFMRLPGLWLWRQPVGSGCRRTTMRSICALAFVLSFAGGTLMGQEAAVRPLLSKDLAGDSTREVTMISVEYPPGGTDPVHRHDAQAL